MASNQKLVTSAALFTLVFAVLGAAGPCPAHAAPPPPEAQLSATDGPTAGTESNAGAADPAAPADPQASTTGATPAKAGGADSEWHVTTTPYLWFPGMRGTIGATGGPMGVYREVSVHASAVDILSDFRFGLAGTVEFRRKRLLFPVDMMWVRLGDNKALPFQDLGATSADMTVNLFFMTPQVGYRLFENEKFKIDAGAGFRYWHLGETLNFEPGTLGLNLYKSENVVDPIVSGKIEAALSPKVVMTIAADVGGFGAGSKLEGQMVGLLGYKIKPNLALQAGYRYLSINYRSGGSVFDVIMSGIAFGLTIGLK